MKIQIEFDIEIEGALSEDGVREVFQQYISCKLNENIITSESVTDNPNDDSYAIIVNGWNLVDK